MRNIIIQYYDPYVKDKESLKPQADGRMPPWMYIGMLSAQEYAKRIGCEYMFLKDRELMDFGNPFLSGMTILFDEEFDLFDNILLMDCDMIIQTNEDIFAHAISDKCSMVHQWNDIALTRRAHETPYKHSLYAYAAIDKLPKSKYHPGYNLNLSGGLQLWGRDARRQAREKFMRPDEWYKTFRKTEQPYLNTMLIAHDMYNELDNSWNISPTFIGTSDDEKILHYGGQARKFAMFDYVEGKPLQPVRGID